MNRITYTLVFALSLAVLPVLLYSQTSGTFTDARDNHTYNWAKYGSQVWMAENLKFGIPVTSWAYDSDSMTEVNYGRLYSWKAAQTACPKGWHLPSDKEWNTLIQFLGGSSVAGEKLQTSDTAGKKTTLKVVGNSRPTTTLLSGVRHSDGSTIGITLWGGCWSAGKVNDSTGSNVLFARGAKELAVSSNDMKTGFSVRCIRNK
jgi:uncharacterized protein (TIGR02145 family)